MFSKFFFNSTPYLLLLVYFGVPNLKCLSQDLDTNQSSGEKNSYFFRMIPSVRDNIYGIAFGLFGSEVICNHKNLKKSHGLNVQIFGQGLFIPINRRAFTYKRTLATDSSWMVVQMQTNEMHYKAKHNGILISGFGTMTDESNGIVLSGLSSMGYKVNGIAFNLLSSKYYELNGLSIALNNESYIVKGIQCGLINRTKKLKGFQFGLWNVNEKRKLPLINWSFK